ncbi:MAG: type II toxin-antitoxin system RelE/ParE family toxin [Rhodanobacteraceae bacterium]
MPMVFIETSVFTRQVQELLTDDEYADFQSALAANPLTGDVIEGTGGLRKVRVAAQGRGKRGGARVIYYYVGDSAQIRLLLIYAKWRKDDLSADEKRTLRHLNERW